jgi:DNA replication and repair protein RecF
VNIKTIKVEKLRNINHAELCFSSSTNLIVGNNGAGKTSLLEAIYLLARARSFRQGQQKSQINKESDHLLIYAITEDQHQHEHRIGFYRTRAKTRVKIDGKKANKLSSLAKNLPTVLITPHSHRLIEEGPEHRRRILNWGVFHVEHQFQSQMATFSRSLAQRNTALRSGSTDLQVWDKAFLESAQAVYDSQERYFGKLKQEIFNLSEGMSFLEGLEIKFYRGWNKNFRLADLLKDRITTDKERGFTGVGPQRADIEISIGRVPTKQLLSRGQQKLLVTIILLAQSKLLEKSTGEKPIFLFDDLESELDNQSIETICRLIATQQSQTFLTSLNAERLITFQWSNSIRMFHVEHGRFCS